MNLRTIHSALFPALTLLAVSRAAAAAETVPVEVKVAKPTEKAAAQVEVKADVTHEAQASLGGFFAAGNTSSLAGKADGFYQLRAFRHGLRVEAGGGLAGIAVDTDGNPATGYEIPLDKNINTLLNGKLRYDFFFTEEDTGYASVFGLHDSAAKLATRIRAEAGYRRFIFHQDKHALSIELGAVYTIERAPYDGDTNADGKIDLGDDVRFEKSGGSAGTRLMLAYVNALSENLALSQSFEVIPNLWPELEAPYERARVDTGADDKLGIAEATTCAATTALTLNPAKNLALSFLLGVGYDFGAVARRNAYTNYDVNTSIAVSYKFF
ncbi:MAG: DUF481 domain-containing protein [Deltaproteobacteria bacterium]|nr:DUF481 domain-containing protein [Deltaproteobacteria bacterium]